MDADPNVTMLRDCLEEMEKAAKFFGQKLSKKKHDPQRIVERFLDFLTQ